MPDEAFRRYNAVNEAWAGRPVTLEAQHSESRLALNMGLLQGIQALHYWELNEGQKRRQERQGCDESSHRVTQCRYSMVMKPKQSMSEEPTRDRGHSGGRRLLMQRIGKITYVECGST